MEDRYKSLMAELGYSDFLCDIFIDWEQVKDEILESDRKSGSGNGTIHVFLGKEGYNAFKYLYPKYFQQVENTQNTNDNAPKLKHVFLKNNIISLLGHICQYYIGRNEQEKMNDIVSKVISKLNYCCPLNFKRNENTVRNASKNGVAD